MTMVMTERPVAGMPRSRPIAVAAPASASSRPSSATTTSGVVADAHPGVRWRLADALRGTEFDVVAECADGTELRDALEFDAPAVCLVDIDLPGGGLDLVRSLRRSHPSTAIVVLAAVGSDEACFAALLAGAVGYLVKSGSTDRLPETVRGALRGEPALSRTIVARLVEEFRERGGRWQALGAKVDGLTDRQRQILDLTADGLSTRQIAERLGLAAVTVRAHTAVLLKKLDLPDRRAIVELGSSA
jgi:DNA-binding NarL/FixJ family response regulator